MERWRRSFNALMVAELFAIMGFSTSNPIIPMYLQDLGVRDTAALNLWTGLINGVSSLALAFFAPIWGALADSYGRKLMLLRAMAGGSVIMGLLAATNAPWQVLVLKLVQGCITGTVAAATVFTATLVPTGEVGYRLGLMQMAVFAGNSLGPLFGGVITDLAGSRVNFLATAALLAVAALIVLKYVHEDYVPSPRSGSILRNALPDISPLRADGALQSLMVTIFGIQFASAVVGPIMPLIIMDMNRGGGATGSISGLVIGVASAAGALGAVAVGRVSAKVGYGKALFACIAGATLFYLPQGFATQPWQLLVLRALSGFFMGGTMPTANALIAFRADKSRQGAVYGLSASVSSGGNALGPAFGAFMATAAGYPAVFFLTTGLLLVIGIAVGRTVLGNKEPVAGKGGA